MQTDIVIIGAGPVGLFAIFECGMLGFKCHIVDALSDAGGQCVALYPEKPIYDIPAYPKINAAALIDQLLLQSNQFEPTYHLGQNVVAITKNTDGTFNVKTSKGTDISCKGIIIAAGVGAFGPNRPPVSGIEDFEGKTVLYHIKQKSILKDKNIVIAGGGDSALDWAIELADYSAKVTLVHRRNKFKAAEQSIKTLHELVAAGKIDLLISYQLSGVCGYNGKLELVELEDLNGETKKVKCDYFLPFFGLSMNLGPINNWGLTLENKHIVVEQATMMTSCPGICAIGDVAHYPHKLKLILTGFAEAASAAHYLRSYIYPDQVWHFEYSTTQGAPIDKK